MSNLLKDLNPQQQEGVTHTEGPLLIWQGGFRKDQGINL